MPGDHLSKYYDDGRGGTGSWSGADEIRESIAGDRSAADNARNAGDDYAADQLTSIANDTQDWLDANSDE